MISHSKPTINNNDICAVKNVLLSGFLSAGKITQEFERKFSEFIGVKYSLATSSGTSALHLALLSLDVSSGDEVIIPNYICSAVLNAVLYVRAKPVLGDVSIDDYNIDFEQIKKKVNKNTKAIIVSHMFGTPCDIEKFLSFSLPIIEDCAHSPGAEYNNKKVGSFGKISIFSFYATKFITTGEGGMVLTDDKKIYNRIKDLRDYDERKKFNLRYNYKLSDIASALGLSQLSRIKEFIDKRKKIAKIYDNKFFSQKIVLPSKQQNKNSVYYRYCVRLKKRDKMLNELLKNNIEAKIPVFKPLNEYLNLEGFENSKKIHSEILSLPIYPLLKKQEINFIIKIFLEKL